MHSIVHKFSTDFRWTKPQKCRSNSDVFVPSLSWWTCFPS